VKHAIDHGFRNFDVAPHYGLGIAEERLGKALQLHGGDLGGYKIWSKVGRVVVNKNEMVCKNLSPDIPSKDIEYRNMAGHEGCIFPLTPSDRVPLLDYTSIGVLKSYQGSLFRLNLETLYGLRLHDCEDERRFNQSVGVENVSNGKSACCNDDDDDEEAGDDDIHIEETSSAAGLIKLLEMRDKDHVVEDVGLGMNDPSYIMKILQHPTYVHYTGGSGTTTNSQLTSIMMAGKWNLLNQSGYEVLLECQARNIEVHNAGILCSGLLAGGQHLNYRKVDSGADQEVLLKVEEWKTIASKYGYTLYELAVMFAFLPSIVTKIAVGVSRSSEVCDIYNLLNINHEKNSTQNTISSDGAEEATSTIDIQSEVSGPYSSTESAFEEISTTRRFKKFPIPSELWKEALDKGLLIKECVALTAPQDERT
jgi:D-threo-aldose 1-dehydrogenase